MTSVRRSLAGAGAALGAAAVLTAIMAPLRNHISIATPALVLVIPVVIGVAIGGFPSGVVAVVAGFFVYDIAFIPPYGTLSVGAAENWVALGVYVVVMVLVARVVARLDVARSHAHGRETEVRRLFEVTDLLIGEKPLPELLALIVSTVQDAFELRSVTLLLPAGSRLAVAAAAGEPLTGDELSRIMPASGRPTSLGTSSTTPDEVQSVALSAPGGPVGLLGIKGHVLSRHERELLLTFANHIALTVERAQLRSQALRTELLEEIDHLQKALMGAVSHDLRTPLATIKISASTLRNPAADVAPAERQELLVLIDDQVDRLDRLVTNLLDMSRIEAGALALRRHPVAVSDLVAEAMGAIGLTSATGRFRLDVADDLPLVDVDHLLMAQVLANLFDNALRYAPEGTAVSVSARPGTDGKVVVTVTDDGPGVRPEEREIVFQMFTGRGAAGGTGVGLWIAKAFVEAHGEQIWVEVADGHGARFCLSLPTTAQTAAVS
ncbi:MAG TPA: ATP-binding protein [Acidimicrobiales bacterium]|nr:ATP-binding protein [Acidimicrobiales bacterium]